MPRASAADLSTEFNEEEVVARGQTYHFTELSIGDYDELVRKATKREPNTLTGQDDETIDNALLLKLMVIKTSHDPKLTPETLAKLPMRVALKLNQTVNRMHYGDEPESLNGTGETAGDDAEEGEAKGNV